MTVFHKSTEAGAADEGMPRHPLGRRSRPLSISKLAVGNGSARASVELVGNIREASKGQRRDGASERDTQGCAAVHAQRG